MSPPAARASPGTKGTQAPVGLLICGPSVPSPASKDERVDRLFARLAAHDELEALREQCPQHQPRLRDRDGRCRLRIDVKAVRLVIHQRTADQLVRHRQAVRLSNQHQQREVGRADLTTWERLAKLPLAPPAPALLRLIEATANRGASGPAVGDSTNPARPGSGGAPRGSP